MNYIADSYPQEDYGNPYAANGQAQTENGTVTAPQNAAAQANQPAQQQSVEKPAQQTATAQQPAQPASQEAHEEAAAPVQQTAAPAPAEEPQSQPQETYAAASDPQNESEASAAASSWDQSAEGSAHEGNPSEETDPLRAEAEDLKRKWYAVTAEYENYRKRTANVRQEA